MWIYHPLGMFRIYLSSWRWRGIFYVILNLRYFHFGKNLIDELIVKVHFLMIEIGFISMQQGLY